MTDQHPITPPPELELQWEEDWLDLKVKHKEFGPYMAECGAQWGADQELEACCEWLNAASYGDTLGSYTAKHVANDLRAARRPKPPSLKAQALRAAHVELDPEGRNGSLIIRALEALPDD